MGLVYIDYTRDRHFLLTRNRDFRFTMPGGLDLLTLLAFVFRLSQGVTPEPLDANSDDFYEILAVRHDADTAEIKSAYRKLSLQWHPDKHVGKPTAKQAHEHFIKLSRAYTVLMDHEQREIYDKAGQGAAGVAALEEIKRAREKPVSPFDLFHELFGHRPRRSPGDVNMQLRVTLEDVFSGKSIPVTRVQKQSCPHCSGRGGEGYKHCGHCHGMGVQERLTQLFPGIMMKQVQECHHCHAKGHTVEHMCEHCNGMGHNKKENTVELQLEPGTPDRTMIVVKGAGDWANRAGKDSFGYGDLYVQIVIQPHSHFERNGRNLYTVQDITIVQSLWGVKSSVKHVSGEQVSVETAQHAVAKHGSVLKIKGKGLPSYHNQGDGDLFVQFNVVFPDSPEETLKALRGEAAPASTDQCQHELLLLKEELKSCSKPCSTAGKIPTGKWSAEKALKSEPEFVK